MQPDAVKRLALASAARCLGPSGIHQSSNPRRSSRRHDRGKCGALHSCTGKRDVGYNFMFENRHYGFGSLLRRVGAPT